MKKVFIRCPYCNEPAQIDDCALATSERSVEDKVYLYCCKYLVEKVKQ